MLVQAALLKAIKYCGSKQKKLAELLGEDPDKISYWLNRAKQIPFHQAIAIEKITQGLVSRYDLAPYARLKTQSLKVEVSEKTSLTISERAAVGIDLEKQWGKRQGSRSDLTFKAQSSRPKETKASDALRRNRTQVKGKTSALVAKEAGFASRDSYMRAKKVVQKGIFQLVQAMDKRLISISMASEIADLPPDQQSQLLTKNSHEIKILLAVLRENLRKKRPLTTQSKRQKNFQLLNQPEFLSRLIEHPELIAAEQQQQLPLRLPLIGLLMYCDASGCFPWDSEKIKNDLLPFVQIDFEQVLTSLSLLGFIKKIEESKKWMGKMVIEMLVNSILWDESSSLKK